MAEPTTNDPSAKKAVWIVGAGASVSDTKGQFPTLLGIPAKARELGLIGDGSESEPGYEHLSKYLKSRYYGDLRNSPEPINLEHVLTLLEIDIAVATEPKLQLARKYVLRLLRSTLMRLHRNGPPSNGEYERLVSRLGPTDTVITFNWDLLLDEAFGRTSRLSPLSDEGAGPAFGNPSNRYDEFLQSLTGWGERTIRRVAVPRPINVLANRGYYIKAHGSIDWYYCANPGCRAHETVFPLLGSSKRPVCSGCRERTEVLLIPPTLNKRLRDVPITRRLWTLAAAEMKLATEVIVWGYSLPPTDFFSEWLLRHARSTKCKRLVIINPGVLNGNELNSPFIERFIRSLRKPSARIKLEVYESFAAFEERRSAAVGTAVDALRVLSGYPVRKQSPK